jgi:rhamnopyranosyl-N-acetylglucosaminyl-diphospho-decaprenol beta-1,3/1,4-galactofuranosyltransferase
MTGDSLGRSVRVAAAVATYNRKDTLRECLSALLRQSRPPDEVILVDNGSSDGTDAMVAEEFPCVRLVQMGENTGAAGAFAAGLQEGVARGHDWVWVFNDDDLADPHALATMLTTAGGLPPRTGIVACGRHNRAGEPYGLGLRWQHRHMPIPPADPEGPPLPIDVVTFSGTLVASALVRDIGVPRSDFFMMIEDLDYCLRARRAGWEIFVLPQLLINAFALGSDGRAAPWRGYYQTRNQLTMILERRSIRELFWWFVRTAKFCAAAIRSGDRPVERVRLRLLGAWHAVRGVSGRTIPPTAAT